MWSSFCWPTRTPASHCVNSSDRDSAAAGAAATAAAAQPPAPSRRSMTCLRGSRIAASRAPSTTSVPGAVLPELLLVLQQGIKR